jgi:uncharacterized membrane protein
VKQLRESIKPGKVYLAVLVSHVNPEKALEEVKRYAGMAELVTTTNVTPDSVARLQDALDQDHVTEGVSEDESTIAE